MLSKSGCEHVIPICEDVELRRQIGVSLRAHESVKDRTFPCGRPGTDTKGMSHLIAINFVLADFAEGECSCSKALRILLLTLLKSPVYASTSWSRSLTRMLSEHMAVPSPGITLKTTSARSEDVRGKVA